MPASSGHVDWSWRHCAWSSFAATTSSSTDIPEPPAALDAGCGGLKRLAGGMPLPAEPGAPSVAAAAGGHPTLAEVVGTPAAIPLLLVAGCMVRGNAVEKNGGHCRWAEGAETCSATIKRKTVFSKFLSQRGSAVARIVKTSGATPVGYFPALARNSDS